MIPLKLTLEGLYSYQQRQTIDFTELTASGIFGIFGKVGSGKSAILDAITFALYGKTDRTDTDWDYNMMNLKSDELFIEFEFLSNTNVQYRFTAYRKRSSKTFANISVKKNSASRLEGGEWVHENHKNAPEIIGLSYSNFLKTIIIPQGKFQEFLQLKPGERTEMLKEIFQLQRFDLQNKVKALLSENNNAVQEISGIMQGIGTVTPEEIVQQEAELAELVSSVAAIDTQVAEQNKALEAANQLKDLFQKLETARAQSQHLDAQQAEMNQRAQRLAQYEQASRDFRDLMARIQQQETQLAQQSQAIAQKEQLVQSKNQQAETWASELESLQPEYDQLDQWKEKAEDLKVISDVRAEEKRRDSKRALIKQVNANFTERDKEKDQKEAQYKRKKLQLSAIKDKLMDPAQLRILGQWYQKAKLLGDETQERSQEFRAGQEEVMQLTNAVNIVIEQNGHLIPKEVDSSKPEALLESFTESETKGGQFVQEANAVLNELLVKERLGAFADSLEEGAPCPLCGSTDHPEIAHTENVQPEVAKQRALIQKAEDRLKGIRNLRTKLDGQFLVLDRERKALAQKQAKVEESRAEDQAHRKAYPGAEEPDLNAYSKLVTQDTTTRKHIAELEKQIQDEEKDLEILREDLVRLQSNIEKENAEIGKMEARIEGNRSRIRRLRMVDYAKADPVILLEKAMKQSEKVEATRRRFEHRKKELETLRETLLPLQGELKSDRRKQEEDQAELAQEQDRLRERMEQSDFGSQTEIQQVLSLSLNPEAEKQQLDQFRMQLAESGAMVKELETQTQGRTFDPVAYQTLTKKVTALNTHRDETTRRIGEKEGSIKKMQVALQQLKEYTVKMDGLRIREANLDTLLKLFRGKGFVDYISSIYLKELCNRANARFRRLTRNKLQLEVTETNSFRVRDFLNGGQTRSVKTLSGGQTFQASLSLALALADSVQQLSAASRNFFFLDEGFGTLDKDAIQVVFETLKSLRKENRIVGVISHVEDLQSEIDVFLKVENDEEKGSLVVESWR